MVEKKMTINDKREELIILGIEGKTMISEVAKTWGGCNPETIVGHLYFIQQSQNYVLLIDGKGYFRFFKDFQF